MTMSLCRVFLCLIVKAVIFVKVTSGGGTMKIALETYRFEVSLTSDDDDIPVSDDSDILADIDYVKDYSPLWRLKTSLEQDYENTTTDMKETAYSYWPWDGPTNCVAPVRFRFLVCLDYVQSYDPTRKCQLGRVQSQLMDVSRDRFSSTILGRKTINFGSLMRVLDDGDIITNPVGFDFDEWKGPLRLKVYVSCCGGSRFIVDRCDDELKTTLLMRPQSQVGGIQAMRYSVDGKGSLTFSINANCDKNYYGRSCDVFCKIEQPALEHAMCNTSTGQKQCMPGWQGSDCQTDVDECRGLMCKNGGTCQNIRGTYSCTCPFGTRGRRCQTRYPVCHLQPCQHQGTCLETPAGALCFCMPGFDGQWCHLLEDEDKTSRKVTGHGSRSHEDDSKMVSPSPVRTVVVHENKTEHKSSSTWHDWYLAIIFGVFILIAILIVLVFLLYRARVRQQYKVTIPESTLLPVQALPKSRVFDNAVYERDDESGIIQPNTFQIFYDSKNITDILNNANNNNNNIHPHNNHNNNHNNNSNNNNTITNDISKNKSKVDNKGVLLNASALIHDNKPGTTSGMTNVNNDHEAKAKVVLPTRTAASSRSPKVENKSKSQNPDRRNNTNVFVDKDIRPYSVETIERGGVDVRRQKDQRTKIQSPKHQLTDQHGQFYNVPSQSNQSPMVDRWKQIGVYSSPKSPSSGKFEFAGSSYQSEYKEPNSSSEMWRTKDNGVHRNKGWHTGGSYVQYGADTNTRQREHHRKRKSEFMKSAEMEHEYEDIESVHGFKHRPTPKPRSVYNVQCETLKRRYAVPDEMIEFHDRGKTENERTESHLGNDSNKFDQSYRYHRRSSDGMKDEHVMRQLQLPPSQLQQHQSQSPETPSAALKNRFDQPRFSEGDIVYPKARPIHKHYCSQYDLKRKPLSLYVSPEDMDLMSNKSNIVERGNSSNHGYSNSSTSSFHGNLPILKSPSETRSNSVNPYSEPRVSPQEEHVLYRGKANSPGQLCKPKQSNSVTSPRGGSRFDFLRPPSRHIYRNTDIEGFDRGKLSPKEPRSPTGRARPKSGDFGSSFRRKSLINLSSSPKTDRRRRKSEVMSEKIFRKKLTSELRSDSETSVDKCWWMNEDQLDSIVNNEDDSKMLSSSAFV